MSDNPLKTVIDLYRDTMQAILTPAERSKVKIVIVKRPHGIDLEGPEELKNKVTAAVQARLKQSKN